MGFCRRCGDIVSGERCKCGGAAVAPVVSWKDHDVENDKWSRTYVLRDRSASLGASQFKGNTKSASTALSADLSAKVSAHIMAVASDPQVNVPLRPTVTGPAPEAGILPSPSDSTLSKVYGSVLQPKESLATFSCWVCGDVFPPDATIYPDPGSPDLASSNRFLCRGCFVDNGGTKGTCPTCSRPVLTLKSEGGFVHSAGKYWHKRCFNCNECHRNIGDAPLVDLLGRPSCSECFDSCLRRPSERDQSPMTPTKPMRHSPVARRNIGGIDTTNTATTQIGLNSREASPALEELEQRLGIVRGTREGSPSLEELSQRLSLIGKENPRARRDSRHSERYRSPDPDDVFSSSPERTGGLRHSTGTPSPVRRQRTDSSPVPTPEAIEEMKSRFMKNATASSPSMSSSPLNHLAQSFSTTFPSHLHTPSRARSSSSFPTPDIPNRFERSDEVQEQEFGCIADENDASLSVIHDSPTDTPDLASDTSDDAVPLSPIAEVQGQRDVKLSTINQYDEVGLGDAESNSRKSADIYDECAILGSSPVAVGQRDDERRTSDCMANKKVGTNITPPSKIPVPSKSLGKETVNTVTAPASAIMPASSSTARCTKCTGLLFTNGEGRFLTLPAEEGAKSKMYHVECFRCVICEGTFKEAGNGQAIFVKTHGGPCHIECAPPERHIIRKSISNGPRSNYVNSAVAASDKTTETAKTSINRTATLSPTKSTNPPHSSSRYEPPSIQQKPSNLVISPNSGAYGNSRFGSRTVCPGCNMSVSPMERGVVPGPQGTRWHATCLVCGGKRRKDFIAQQKSALWMVGRGGFDERKNDKPGCGKKLDSAAKTGGDGGVWCRECLLLLGSLSPLEASSTGTAYKGIASQHTGTTIVRQFTGLNSTSEFGKESGLLRQLTGGGLSPTRSISPTKQMGGSFWSGASTSGRPRPKSMIGIRSTKSIDEGRGMYLVRQMTGNSHVAREA